MSVVCIELLILEILMHITVNWVGCGYTEEEVGGIDGMKIFVRSEEFRSLNCGFALDEGIACWSKKFIFFNLLWIHCEILQVFGKAVIY